MVRASVIIPAYNAAGTLEKAVQSALDQTERDIEVLIVEDCSPQPETWALAQALAAKHPQVRAIRLPENRGKSYAVNHGTSQARGEWIALLDSDDWYAPTRLERLISAAEKAHVQMVADNQFLIDKKADIAAGIALPYHGEKRLDINAFLDGSDPMASFDYGMLKPVFHADFVRKNKIEYYEQGRVGEDYYVLLCFFMAGGQALVVGEPLYYYVQPFGTISREWAEPGRKPYDFKLMKEIHDYYMGIYDGKLTASQKQRLLHRGVGIDMMIRFYKFREAMRKREFLRAAGMLLFAPPRFWALVTRRALQRLSKMI